MEGPVGPQPAVRLAQKLRQARGWDRGQPVRGPPRGGAARPVDLQRFVRRIGDHEVDGLGREAAQELERVGNDDAPGFGGMRGGEWKLEQVGFAHAGNLPELPDTAVSRGYAQV